MARPLLISALLTVVSLLGCSRSHEVPVEPGDPRATEGLIAHWSALRERNWRAAYDRFHPDVKSAFTLKQFTDIQSRRTDPGGIALDIKVIESIRSGDDVLVAFDLLAAPPGGELAAVPPRRKATLRKVGDSWGLITHDILAAMP